MSLTAPTNTQDRPLATPDARHRPQGAGDVGGQASTIDAGVAEATTSPDVAPDVGPATKPQPTDGDWRQREDAGTGGGQEYPDSTGVRRPGVQVNDDDNVLESLGNAIVDPMVTAANHKPGTPAR
ncbi:MAG: hypothetical protein IIZ92_26665 [Aquincola sp.]|nr:hypothetical protein [Aquincola sp.]|tara:strand:+ start:886 stop:1260 length:375 start_codon:yes stop_codon:yes gene_type:complete